MNVEWEGVAALEADAVKIKAGLPVAIAAAEAEAAELTAQAMRDRAANLGSVAEHSAPGFVADKTGVAEDSGIMPPIFGADFGASQFHQFKPFNAEGYISGPAADETEPAVDELFAHAIDPLLGRI